METRIFKVYGTRGHRQRLSFEPSRKYDWSENDQIRIIELIGSDQTGTNEFSELVISRNTASQCYLELEGQLSDGFFENCRYGRVTEVTADGETEIYGEA